MLFLVTGFSTLFGQALAAPISHRSLFALADQAGNGSADFDGWLNSVAAKDLATRRRQIEAIQTRAEAIRRRNNVRERILKLIGGLPERTPLRAQMLGETAADGFVIRKVIFESQPAFPVTALLYVPNRDTTKTKRPAVLISPGHYPAGKAGDARMAALFARNGFVVLSYDPIGLGERLQYADPSKPNTSLAGPPTTEHAEASLQPLLLGDTLSRYVLWDAMRGVDYLASLPEVDSKRIGVFGCSGGGTITALLGALDQRVAAVGVACYITSFDALLPTLGPQDAEQSIPRFISSGLDFPDWIEAAAPRPYAVISTYSDMFPFEGARSSVTEARRFYSFFDSTSAGRSSGAESPDSPPVPEGPAWNADTSRTIPPSAKLQFITGPGKHGALWPIAANILSFFLRNLEPEADADHPLLPEGLANGGPGIESSLKLQPGALQVTKTGQVATSFPGVKTVADLNKRRSETLLAARKKNRTTAELRSAIREVTGAIAIPGTTQFAPELERSSTGAISLPAEGGQVLRGELFLPDSQGRHPAIIVLLPDASESATPAVKADLTRARDLAERGNVILALPPRPSFADEVSAKSSLLGPMYFPGLRAQLARKTLVGIRADDVIHAVDYLVARSDVDPKQISAIASGHAAIVLLHASALDERIRHIHADRYLESYRSLLDAKMPTDITADMIPGVLLRYDIPDLEHALGVRLTRREPPEADHSSR